MIQYSLEISAINETEGPLLNIPQQRPAQIVKGTRESPNHELSNFRPIMGAKCRKYDLGVAIN